MLGLGIDMAFVEAMLKFRFLLGIKLCLILPGRPEEGDSERWSDKSGMGGEIKQKLLAEGREAVMLLGRGRGGSEGRPGVRGSVDAPSPSFEVHVRGKRFSESVHSDGRSDFVFAQGLQ